ncbi:hypothetical protein Plhal710r2_c057g0166701 [Plasmopara halstedii]
MRKSIETERLFLLTTVYQKHKKSHWPVRTFRGDIFANMDCRRERSYEAVTLRPYLGLIHEYRNYFHPKIDKIRLFIRGIDARHHSPFPKRHLIFFQNLAGAFPELCRRLCLIASIRADASKFRFLPVFRDR